MLQRAIKTFCCCHARRPNHITKPLNRSLQKAASQTPNSASPFGERKDHQDPSYTKCLIQACTVNAMLRSLALTLVLRKLKPYVRLRLADACTTLFPRLSSWKNQARVNLRAQGEPKKIDSMCSGMRGMLPKRAHGDDGGEALHRPYARTSGIPQLCEPSPADGCKGKH